MAQVDYFLKIEGIKGESKDSKHAGEIDVISWSWGEANAGTGHYGGGSGAGKVQMQDLHFTMRMNKSSNELMLRCASGEHIKSALLTCRKAGGKQEEYLKITLDDILVSSYQTGGSGNEIVPVDQVSLNFSKIKVEYAEQKTEGGLEAYVPKGWDLKQNKAV